MAARILLVALAASINRSERCVDQIDEQVAMLQGSFGFLYVFVMVKTHSNGYSLLVVPPDDGIGKVGD